MQLKKFLLEKIKAITIGIVVALAVIFLLGLPSILCATFCPQKTTTTIEGVITQNDKPVNNVNIIINDDKNLTGGDGKFVISDIQLEPGLKINIDLPLPPPIDFDSDHYVDLEPECMLRRELDASNYKEILIHFQLTEEEANKNLRLFLDTTGGTHKWDNKTVPYFKMKVKIKPLKEDWNEINDYFFGRNPPAHEEQYITIANNYIGPGENIILLENNNPEGWGYWVFFDSLRLEAIEGDTIWELGKNDGSSNEFFNPWE